MKTLLFQCVKRLLLLREKAPISLREKAPLSLREKAPLSLREKAPLSMREKAPLSLRGKAPLSLRVRLLFHCVKWLSLFPGRTGPPFFLDNLRFNSLIEFLESVCVFLIFRLQIRLPFPDPGV